MENSLDCIVHGITKSWAWLSNFQFHFTVKGFSVVNKAEVDGFSGSLWLFLWSNRCWHWSLVPLPFLSPGWTSGNSRFLHCWNLYWRILSISLHVWDECNCVVIWTFFGIDFPWHWNETDLFQSCGHCWVFQICWHIECSTFTDPSFRIWNTSTGILSPPLALLVVMLSRAHMTSGSRMSGSRWVITLSWLSGSWRSFLYSSSVYSYHLFLISSASVRSIPFLSFIVPILA